MLAFFEAGSGDCPFGDTRGKYLEGTFDGQQIKGKMTRCTRLKVMIEKCGLTPIYDTEFYTESVTRDRITGCWKSEYYGPADKTGGGTSSSGSDGAGGAGGDCPFVRDASGDKYRPVVLTRKEPSHCPDMVEIEQIDQVAERAAGFIRVAAGKVQDPKMQGVLESSQGTLEGIASTLGLLVKVGQKCQEIHDALGDLRRFRDAIDEVNGAACGQASAAAFDHLFTAAGNLGERFVRVEGLGALFQLLAANVSFFQDVSGAINPEQRWADQFAGIEGYTPACPG